MRRRLQIVKQVAVVTGSNKGIGYGIVKGLCEKFDGLVILTARDTKKGEAAVKKLSEIGCDVIFHQLDITDQESIDTFQKFIEDNYGGIDILVNNAGVTILGESTIPLADQAESILSVNYFGTANISKALYPLLRNKARVVNLVSSFSFLSKFNSDDLKAKFKDPSLTEEGLNDLMNQYIRDCKDNKNVTNGWPSMPYVVSKIGVIALTKLKQRDFDKESTSRNISVNAVYPGFVSTDLTGGKGTLTIDQGARAPLNLALSGNKLKGEYVWCDSTPVDWEATSPPKDCTA